MQQLFVQKGCMRLLSLPVWGEWIEIEHPGGCYILGASLPVWGEWIEMSIPSGGDSPRASLPVWGEWIEISSPQR